MITITTKKWDLEINFCFGFYKYSEICANYKSFILGLGLIEILFSREIDRSNVSILR